VSFHMEHNPLSLQEGTRRILAAAKQGKDPPLAHSKPISGRAFNRVIEACERAGLDPGEEILKLVSAEDACKTCGHTAKISDKMRADIWVKLLEFVQPKLRAIEGDINVKELSLVQILSSVDDEP